MLTKQSTNDKQPAHERANLNDEPKEMKLTDDELTELELEAVVAGVSSWSEWLSQSSYDKIIENNL